MPTKTATHLLLAHHGHAVAVGGPDMQPAPGERLVEIATADVATLATVAAEECPKLLARGPADLAWIGGGDSPARPYLLAMLDMRGVTVENIASARYYDDQARDVVNRFCGNATAWKGETARAVKAGLRAMIAR